MMALPNGQGVSHLLFVCFCFPCLSRITEWGFLIIPQTGNSRGAFPGWALG
jgi:hypothetical protein